MGVWLGPRGKRAFFYIDSEKAEEGTHNKYIYYRNGDDWEIAILQNCNVKFSQNILVDLFLVGSGQPGSNGKHTLYDPPETATGGAGGNGGKLNTEENISINANQSYSIIIGENGNSTTGFGKSSENENYAVKTGGRGAVVKESGGFTTQSDYGKKGELAFFDTNVTNTQIASFKDVYFGSSGAGGGAQTTSYNTGNTGYREGKFGGATNKNDNYDEINGCGGNCSSDTATSGRVNCGQGGGGGGATSKIVDGAPHGYSGGAGGSGIIIIRNHRP